ncbi:MAG: nicotinate (nicotinamide) nucleotide adenylyltransferase [Oscillospiraceae bacterium]|nr:nicotinate (nicotinamide) nucleotide adenylyltransferase [Oscillospiraceae bacterium]
MERIGIYGGTFNPPHIGHLQAARAAVRALALSKLLLIPDRVAPHKKIPAGSPDPEQRLAMLRAAEDDPCIQVSDIELRRQGVSYTYLTILELKQQYPDAELVLFMGTDMFLSLHTWVNPHIILENASIGVFYRGEKGEKAAIDARKEELERTGATVYLVQNDVIRISSTQLRRMLAFHCADAFLPGGVGDYIREKNLYQVHADWKNLPMEQLEPIVISLIDPKRVNHVLGCRDTAVALAKHWGADVTDAARAGILHDITKALDGPLQLTLCDAYGKILTDFSRKYPKTLHALTGSLVAERIFGENQAVVDAICHHTTGKADMTLLEKIIYVADYMEPCRDFPGVEKLRELAFSDIDAALKLGLEMTLEHLKRQGAEVSPASREALAWLNKE